ncbi:MAG: BON domain-containing protein [Burkholderiaceae bacterium]
MRRALVAIAVWSGFAAATDAADEPRRNVFDDPFVQLTHGLPACPVPPGPLLTEAEARAQAHGRAERGTSCFRAGRCRLPNSYLYDREIMPRVQKAVDADGRFERTTSVWATGQRRWVWLQGCVGTAADGQALEALVRGLDDVEGVVNELVVVAVPDAR